MNNVFGPTSFTFEGVNWSRVLMVVLTTVAGAVLTALTTLVGHIDWSHIHAVLFGFDVGQYLPLIVMGAWTNLANIVRKWISNNE